MMEIEKKSRWKRPGRLIPLLVIAFFVLSFTAFRIASGSGVKREIEALRQQGLPVTPLELDAWYKPVPAGDNAALAYLDALQDYVTPGPNQNPSEWNQKTAILGQPLPPELAAAATAYVTMNRETLEGIHAAAELTASRYPIDLSKGPDTLLPHLAQVKKLAQLLKWEAIHYSAKGERELAVRSILSAFALASSISEEPILISELVRIASVTITLQALERIVTEHELTEKELVTLSEALQRAEQEGKELLRRALIGERAMGIPLFKMSYQDYWRFSTMGAGPGPSDPIPEALKATLFNLRRTLGFQHHDLAFYLRSMAQHEKAATLEYSEMLRAGNQAHDLVEETLKGHPIKYMVSRMLLASLGRTLTKEIILATRLRGARIALAIERYRLRNDSKLPSTNELVPTFFAELPRDPADDSALQYEKLNGKGYRIVSAAATAEFKRNYKGTNRADVAFTILR